MARLLVVSPHMDLPTSISVLAARHLVEWAEDKGHEVRWLYGPEATPPVFFSEVRRFRPHLISFYDHGHRDRLYGQFFVPLVTKDNVGRIGATVMHTMACESAAELGREAVRKGLLGYFGSVTTMYGAFPEPDHDYLKDWIDCQTVIPKMLLEGRTAGEAYRAYIRKHDFYIRLYKRMMRHWFNADWYMMAFKYNRDYYVYLGDDDARLPEVPAPILPYDVEWVVKSVGIIAAGVALLGALLLR